MQPELPQLDTDIARVLRERESRDQRPLWELTPEEARQRSEGRSAAGRELADDLAIEDLILELPRRRIPGRLYKPAETADTVIVFFHGGGFVTGSISTHDEQARMLSRTTGRPVLSIAYRLAPEFPFPAAFNDGVDSVRWAVEHLPLTFGTRLNIAVAGSSAGANLAAGASAALSNTPYAPSAQLLVYPLLSAQPTLSRQRMATGYGLTSKSVGWYLSHYLSHPQQANDVRFSPLAASSFSGLPPTVISAAYLDPLHDDALDYACLLRRAGIHVELLDNPHLNHAFWGYMTRSPAARIAAEDMCKRFTNVLNGMT